MILDLFAGPGGWSVGLSLLGHHDIGLEWDKSACLTRAAAGHLTIRADVSNYPTAPFKNRVTGLIASPPCQDWSVAGKQAGMDGYRGRLIFEVLRWTEALQPDWIACEQVTPCLPIWEDFARIMRQRWGYYAWTGILNSADYGVPQCRNRAILMASRHPISAPMPTHTERRTDDIFGSGLLPWVTMFEGLGWGLTERPSGTVVARTHDDERSTGGIRPLDGGSGARATYAKAQAAGTWVKRAVEASERFEHTSGRTLETTRLRTLQPDQEWARSRPATTVVGSFRPDIIAAPGYRVSEEDGSRQDAPGSIECSLEEVAILQSFPADYPWQGSKTKKFQQVGNAIPPLLARAIVAELL